MAVTQYGQVAGRVQEAAPVTVERTGNNGIAKDDEAFVGFFSGASASDVCDTSVTPADDAPDLIELGINPITLSAPAGSTR